MYKNIFLSIGIAALTIPNSFSQSAGTLDSGFNSIDVGYGNGVMASGNIQTAALQNDGKIIIGGDFTSYNGTTVTRIARLNANKILDTTFQMGTGANYGILAIAIQPNGKIIIGGAFTTYNSISKNFITRLNTDGTLDTSFNVGTGTDALVKTISLQSDGKIIIAGAFNSYNGTASNRLARLNSNGSIDSTFLVGLGANNIVQTTAIQNDGKIVIGGRFTTYNGTVSNHLARLSSNGTIDTTFILGTGANDYINTSVIQNDGKIVIAGRFTAYSGKTVTRIARLNSNGTLDSTFTVGAGVNDEVFTLIIQNDGKIILGGLFTTCNAVAAIRIVRLNADGTIDNSFIDGGGADDGVCAIALQSDGKIIVAGWFSIYNGTAVKRLARLNTNGILDNTFTIIGTGANDFVHTTALQNDGKIIIGGQFVAYNGTTVPRLARLNSDGTLDTTFNVGMGANNTVFATAIQPDGKIIIGGDFTTYNGAAVSRVARLNNDGTLDTTFTIGTGANLNVQTISVQADGKIVIGGFFTTYNGTTRNRIARLNADGTLDNSYFTGSGVSSTVYTSIIQSDGKIIIGGAFSPRIARFDTNGYLDPTFTVGLGPNVTVYTSALQNDGKIIIGGVFTSYNGTSIKCIARLDTNGTLDNTFNPGTGANSSIFTTAIQPNGKIIIGGAFSTYNGVNRNRIARLNTDGTLDSTFSMGNGANNSVKAVTMQSDGKIVIGGNFTAYNGIGRNFITRIFGDATCITQIYNNPQTICLGGSYVINGHNYNTSGVYNDTLQTISGCDSVIVTQLTVTSVALSVSNTIVQDTLPLTWNIIPNYSSNVTSAKWSWGDGSSTVGLYPSHTYAGAGNYSICVTVYATSCNDSATVCNNYNIYKTDNSNTVIQVNVVPSVSTNIKESTNNSYQFSVFPNPATNTLTIANISQRTTIRLYDTLGKLVLEKQTEEYLTVDVSNLPQGVYTLLIEDGKNRVYKKIAIKH
jgi:uncharacterized delta-60 repeat protein